MISVIIPVYNAEDYLYVCLNSVLKQTFSDFEIICIDDASSDSSLDILEYFSKKDSRIKIIKNGFNRGPGYSRNCGLNVAEGKYIFFLDADDWINFNTFEILIKKADENDLDLLLFDEINFHGETHEFSIDNNVNSEYLVEFENKIFNHFDFSKKKLFELPNTICNKLYLKSFLVNNDIFFSNENLAYENISFFYKVITNAERVSLINDRLYNHCENNSLFRKSNDERLFDIFAIYEDVLNFFIKNKQLYQYYGRLLVNHIFSNLEMGYDLLDNKLKERFFIEIQSLFSNFIKYYGLYWDITENVDSKILNRFYFEDILERISNPPMLTVVVPVFNTEDYLPAVLESIINQTIGLDNIEVILVDDCSTDKSRKIVDDYSKKYESIIGIHLFENSKSPSKPRNIGIRNASANYIIFQDSDDGFTLDACELLHKVAVEEDVDVVTGMIARNDDLTSYKIALNPWDAVLKSCEKYQDEDVKSLLESDKLLKLKLNSIDDNPLVLKDYALNSVIFKKSFLVKNNFKFEEYLNAGEDAIFLFKNYIKANGIIFINKIIYNYNTQREDSLTHIFSSNLIKNRTEAYRVMYEYSVLNNKKDICVENVLAAKIPYWFDAYIFKVLELEDDVLLSIFKSNQTIFSECINYNLKLSSIIKSVCQDIKDDNFIEAVNKVIDFRKTKFSSNK